MKLPSKDEINRQLYSKSYYRFFVECIKVLEPQTVFQDNWHIKYLCDELQEIIERVGNKKTKKHDLIINIPPRSMKSMITTVCLNAWAWIDYPHLDFISCSYNMSLAGEHCQKTRALIESEWYKNLFGDRFELLKDQNQKTNFKNNKSGQRNISSTGSSSTGKGADIIIFDDTLNPQLASSDNGREDMKKYYFSTMFNRLNDQMTGVRIIVEQRLHQEDLTGLLQDKNGFKHICLPVEKNDNVLPLEAFDMYYGDYLFEDRFTPEIIESFQENLGAREYATQYLQQPSPSKGEIFNVDNLQQRFKKADLPQDIVRNFYSDTAYGKNAKSDYNATLCYSEHLGRIYFWAYYNKKTKFPQYIIDHKNFLEANEYDNRSRDWVEPKATGVSVIQSMIEQGLNILEAKSPADSKVTRAEAVTAIIDSGRCLFYEGVNWEFMIEQAKVFPNGKNDDLVDCLVGILGMCKPKKKQELYTEMVDTEYISDYSGAIVSDY
jgi:predicted phage terminase large subunit-like protein